MKTFVLGDIHGAHRALVQVLERSGFDKAQDRLIFLGDVVDGWPESKECIDELLTVTHLIALRGNHDHWFLEWALKGIKMVKDDYVMWVQQGGRATLDNYYRTKEDEIPPTHLAYLLATKPYHEENNRMFVHGGWWWWKFMHPSQVDIEHLMWDRSLWKNAVERAINGRTRPLTLFEEVYIGHTTSTHFGFLEPVLQCGVWNLDQGAGWEGKLSIMDVDTKQYWQSDLVRELYPEVEGRK